MAQYFEKGALPDGSQGDIFVMERGPGDVAKFPADALTPNGRTTYREEYADTFDRYQRGEQPKPAQRPEAARNAASSDPARPQDHAHVDQHRAGEQQSQHQAPRKK